MSDAVATVLALAFTMLVCLMALHAILSPMLRRRRGGNASRSEDLLPASAPASASVLEPETTAVHS